MASTYGDVKQLAIFMAVGGYNGVRNGDLKEKEKRADINIKIHKHSPPRTQIKT